MKELDRPKYTLRFEHDKILIFLRDYMKEFRPLTDIIVSEMDQYVYREVPKPEEPEEVKEEESKSPKSPKTPQSPKEDQGKPEEEKKNDDKKVS